MGDLWRFTIWILYHDRPIPLWVYWVRECEPIDSAMVSKEGGGPLCCLECDSSSMSLSWKVTAYGTNKPLFGKGAFRAALAWWQGQGSVHIFFISQKYLLVSFFFIQAGPLKKYLRVREEGAGIFSSQNQNRSYTAKFWHTPRFWIKWHDKSGIQETTNLSRCTESITNTKKCQPLPSKK